MEKYKDNKLNKILLFGIVLTFFVVMININLVSAGWFSDAWNNLDNFITGKNIFRDFFESFQSEEPVQITGDEWAWCYQENFTQGNSCGALGGGEGEIYGNIVINKEYAFDGDWNTGASLTFKSGTMLVNYTKPVKATAAEWIIKHSIKSEPIIKLYLGDTRTKTCLEREDGFVRLGYIINKRSGSQKYDIEFFCYKPDNSRLLLVAREKRELEGSITTPIIYEEGINWSVPAKACTLNSECPRGYTETKCIDDKTLEITEYVYTCSAGNCDLRHYVPTNTPCEGGSSCVNGTCVYPCGSIIPVSNGDDVRKVLGIGSWTNNYFCGDASTNPQATADLICSNLFLTEADSYTTKIKPIGSSCAYADISAIDTDRLSGNHSVYTKIIDSVICSCSFNCSDRDDCKYLDKEEYICRANNSISIKNITQGVCDSTTKKCKLNSYLNNNDKSDCLPEGCNVTSGLCLGSDCIDEDNTVKDYYGSIYNKSRAYDSSGNEKNDSCMGINTNILYEGMCSNGKAVFSQAITCPWGCNDGACVGKPCTPATCTSLGKTCGSWQDGCGGTLNCGNCGVGKTCTNGICMLGCSKDSDCVPGTVCGVNNYCVDSCTPSCNGKTCGPDGCGNSCGTCGIGQICQNYLCVNVTIENCTIDADCPVHDGMYRCINNQECYITSNGSCNSTHSCDYTINTTCTPCDYGCVDSTGVCAEPDNTYLEGIIAKYRFEENLRDSEGDNDLETNLSDDELSDAFERGCGTNDYLTSGDSQNDGDYVFFIENANDLLLDKDGFSIGFWTKVYEGNGALSDIISKYDNYAVGVAEEDLIFLLSQEKGTKNWFNNTNPYSLDLDEWYHVVATYDGSDMVLYVNGRERRTEEDVDEDVVVTRSKNFVVFANAGDGEDNYEDACDEYDLDSSECYFNGAIDELKIWNRTLSEREVTDLYNDEQDELFDCGNNGDLETFSFSVESCTDSNCLNKKYLFNVGDRVYLDYAANISSVSVTSTLAYPNSSSKSIILPTSIILNQEGTYTLTSTARKNGYVSKTDSVIFYVSDTPEGNCNYDQFCDPGETVANCPTDCTVTPPTEIPDENPIDMKIIIWLIIFLIAGILCVVAVMVYLNYQKKQNLGRVIPRGLNSNRPNF